MTKTLFISLPVTDLGAPDDAFAGPGEPRLADGVSGDVLPAFRGAMGPGAI